MCHLCEKYGNECEILAESIREAEAKQARGETGEERMPDMFILVVRDEEIVAAIELEFERMA